MKRLCSILLMIAMNLFVEGQEVISLYGKAIPNSKEHADDESFIYNKDSIPIISNISRPTLTVFLPAKEKRTGAAVIICPGGGYQIAAFKHEGTDVAKRFTEMGVTAFVLKYRIPNDLWMINREIGPLQDLQRAIQLVREQGKQWGIQKNKIGVMGFSAGGHLASTAGTHFTKAHINNPKRTSLRPDFMILIYPVISFTESIGHAGSREKLLGKNPSPEKIKAYSNEQQVTAQTPPTFMVHAKDDGVKIDNTYAFAAALKQVGVPVDMHIYEKGGHGYGMFNKTSPVLWMDLVEGWMKKLK